jgi:hypothetical protein
MEERPWCELKHSNGIDPVALSKTLRALTIRSHNVRVGQGVAKGYERADFADAFERYLSPTEEVGGTGPLHRYNVDNTGFIPPATRYTTRYEGASEPLQAA